MKKYFFFTLLLAISQFGFAQSKNDRAKAEVESVERQRFEAQVKKDFTALEKILADDLLYVHSSGKSDTKTSFMTSIKERKSVYNKVDVEEIMVRPYNNQKAAIVNGVINITQNPVDGKPTYLHLRYTVVYIKNKGKGWQMVTWQSLKLP
jgi:ketosteroid isomerase-like protein